MIAKRERREWRLIFEISRPSIWIEPWRASRKRKSARVNEDLPAPVRPTTPILSLRSTLKVRPLRTGGRSSAYETTRSLTSRRPSVGQAAGGSDPSRDSVFRLEYSMIRSAAYFKESQ